MSRKYIDAGKRLKIGIPQAMTYHIYAEFIDSFARALPADIVYSGKTDRSILDKGVKYCPDDACLPVKIMAGHILSLAEKCDAVAVPRVMTCEYGGLMCPKINGMPELMRAAVSYAGKSGLNFGKSSGGLSIWREEPPFFMFSERLDADNEKHLRSQLTHECRRYGFSRKETHAAFESGAAQWRQNGRKRICDSGYSRRVFVAAHPYNIFDEFASMRMTEKLRKMDIGVITEAAVLEEYKALYADELIKKPYWSSVLSQYGAVAWLEENGLTDGIICLSSFSCGTDSVITELIKNRTKLPQLSLRIDEQTGEAGFDTRLEAFREVLFS